MTTSYDDLLARGYGYVLAVEVEGIGIVFAERIPQRVESSSAPAVPADYTAASSSLLIREGQTIQVEIDRETGIGRGSPWEMLLSWEALEDESLLAALFKQPPLVARLTGAVTYNATTIAVDSVVGWPSSGTGYIGRERIDYTGTSGTAPGSLTGCSRAVLGHAYAYDGEDPGNYSTITSVPAIWRGRFVTLHQHIVSPEGRMLDSTWFAGAYCRQIWRGFIDSTPMPSAFGMRFRCLPLCRLPAREIGSSTELTVVSLINPPSEDWMPPTNYPVYTSAATWVQATVTLKNKSTGVIWTGTGTYIPASAGVMSLGQWVEAARYQLWVDLCTGTGKLSNLFAQPVVDSEDTWIDPMRRGRLQFEWDSSTYLLLEVEAAVGPGCSWIRSVGTESYDLELRPVIFNYKDPGAVGDWVPVQPIDSVPLVGSTVAATGVGWLRDENDEELIRWDSKAVPTAGSTDLNYALIRIAERSVGASSALKGQGGVIDTVHFGATGVTLVVSTGAIDQLPVAVQTLLQSSGTGQRGPYDTLGIGYGIPAAWIDAIPANTVGSLEAALVTDGPGSMAELAGGWFVLLGRCLVQRRTADGEIALTLVPVDPFEVGGAAELVAADIELGGVTVPALYDAPNEIEIDTTAGPFAGPSYVVRSVARIQQEGSRSMEIAAPGAYVSQAVGLASAILFRGRGQSLLTVNVGPWVSLQVGDRFKLKTAHPAQYDFTNATRKPASVPARVVGWKMDLWTGKQALTVLTAGLTSPTMNLCPTATVQSVAGSAVTVATGEGENFADGDGVTFYVVGDEATYEASGSIVSVSGDVLNMSGTPAAWVASGTRVTYPAFASASVTQSGPFVYVDSTKFWGS